MEKANTYMNWKRKGSSFKQKKYFENPSSSLGDISLQSFSLKVFASVLKLVFDSSFEKPSRAEPSLPKNRAEPSFFEPSLSPIYP